MTGWTAAIASIPVSRLRHRRSAEDPAKLLYCLGLPPPLRMPRPAASSTAPQCGNAALLGTGPILTLASYAHKVALIALQHLYRYWFWLNSKQWNARLIFVQKMPE